MSRQLRHTRPKHKSSKLIAAVFIICIAAIFTMICFSGRSFVPHVAITDIPSLLSAMRGIIDTNDRSSEPFDTSLKDKTPPSPSKMPVKTSDDIAVHSVDFVRTDKRESIDIVSFDAKAAASVATIAIIVDDGGNSIHLAQRVAKLNIPLTWAIIPYTPHSKETAALAASNDIPVLLHLPMQAITDKAGNGEYLVGKGMSSNDIRSVTAKALDSMPSVIGLNNHRGSLTTSDRMTIEPVLEELKARGLMFVDSRTIGKSIAYSEAKKKGIKTLKNYGFLDHVADVDSIESRFNEFILAAKGKKIVLICHFRPNTVVFLEKLSKGEPPARFITVPEMAAISEQN